MISMGEIWENNTFGTTQIHMILCFVANYTSDYALQHMVNSIKIYTSMGEIWEILIESPLTKVIVF
jgi:hypothetical protein